MLLGSPAPIFFVASANVILYERAIPIFVDIDPETLNIDPALVAEGGTDKDEGRTTNERWLPSTMRNPKSASAVDRARGAADGDPPRSDPATSCSCPRRRNWSSRRRR